MGLLARFVQGVREGPRLIDYELLVGKDGKRCVGFGWFAGGSFRFFSFFHARCPTSYLLPYLLDFKANTPPTLQWQARSSPSQQWRMPTSN